ncbi:hypothetical protein GCM10022234_26320 [Aeromicrobium panaciterrae]
MSPTVRDVREVATDQSGGSAGGDACRVGLAEPVRKIFYNITITSLSYMGHPSAPDLGANEHSMQ